MADNTLTLERIVNTPIRYEQTAEEIAAKVATLSELRIDGLEDKEGYEAVRSGRLELKAIRVAIENRRKALKADSLEYGRKVDAMASQLKGMIEPTERKLEDEEKRIDDEKARIKREAEEAHRRKIQERINSVVALGVPYDLTSVQGLADDEYVEYFARLQDQAMEQERQKAEQEKRRKAEEERLRAERAELEKQRQQQEAEARRIEAERARLEADERAKEEAAAKELRERESTVPQVEVTPAGEIVEAESQVIPETVVPAENPVIVQHSPPPPVFTPMKQWRSAAFIETDAESAADRALQDIEDYRPGFRRAFILSVIEALRKRADELPTTQGN